MRISIVLATYNGADFIKEQLKSILEQTKLPDEVIIVDDGSTDTTIFDVSSFIKNNGLDWVFLQNTTNKGFCKNFIDAIFQSTGDLIFLADQDDVWAPTKIEEMSNAMKKNPNIWSLVCNFSLIDDKGNIIRDNVFKGKNNGAIKSISLKRFVDTLMFPGTSMCFRKECTRYLKIISDMPLISHDWAINVFTSAMKKFFFIDRDLVFYRQHGHNAIGFKPNTHDFSERRKERISEQITHFEQAHQILERINESFECEKGFLEKRMELYNYRVQVLDEKNMCGVFWLLRNIRKYPHFRTFFGDCLYLING